uniref:Uncharacterized protein TCIL3000_8_2800 n=1 Tax=Trypanosoma congolense (strain IL3000) TaxID=1068625 RepID=G0URP9_TRYCI|nr:unnamed protein product [Trypanosoma congolense IL3000]
MRNNQQINPDDDGYRLRPESASMNGRSWFQKDFFPLGDFQGASAAHRGGCHIPERRRPWRGFVAGSCHASSQTHASRRNRVGGCCEVHPPWVGDWGWRDSFRVGALWYSFLPPLWWRGRPQPKGVCIQRKAIAISGRLPQRLGTLAVLSRGREGGRLRWHNRRRPCRYLNVLLQRRLHTSDKKTKGRYEKLLIGSRGPSQFTEKLRRFDLQYRKRAARNVQRKIYEEQRTKITMA